MFRSALVALKPDRAQSLISLALDFAKDHQLELGGISIVDRERIIHRDPIPVPTGGVNSAYDRDDRRLETANQLARSVCHEFQSACNLAGVRAEANVFEGDTTSEIAFAAMAYDVLICGHTPGGDVSDRTLLHALLKHNARPAIVVPRDPVRGSNVMLAYDGSFQASRALATLVYSGLLTNRVLHVVCLHEDYGSAAARSVNAMSFLRRHGVAAESHPEVLVKHPAEQLLETARRHDVGLIAMGAFGKSALREFFFGSVTQTMLEKLSVPVLIDH